MVFWFLKHYKVDVPVDFFGLQILGIRVFYLVGMCKNREIKRN
jgi:hypothetical protein